MYVCVCIYIYIYIYYIVYGILYIYIYYIVYGILRCKNCVYWWIYNLFTYCCLGDTLIEPCNVCIYVCMCVYVYILHCLWYYIYITLFMVFIYIYYIVYGILRCKNCVYWWIYNLFTSYCLGDTLIEPCNVCMYVCVCVYIYIYIHTHTHTHTHTRGWVQKFPAWPTF